MTVRRAATPRRRRIAVVTGSRAEYGVLRSTLRALAADERVELQLVVTGMHLLRAFGSTVGDIVRDGWTIAERVPMQHGTDHPLDQAEGVARGVAGMARFFEQAATELVVVLGDRIEAMAGALAAVTTGRVLAHIHGGDVAPGDFDDSLRHAITKLAHLHFPATKAAARRIIRLGEAPRRVRVVGAPGLDDIYAVIRRARAAGQNGRAAGPPAALIVQHAYGRSPQDEERVMTDILTAAQSAGLRRRVILPNTDRGHTGVLRAIERHMRESKPGTVETHPSLPRAEYLRALIASDVLLGNSSSGIIEAPIAGTPSINIGRRQAGREAGGATVLHAAESYSSIRRAVRRALSMRRPRRARSAYGAGGAGTKIARLLAETPITPVVRNKLISY